MDKQKKLSNFFTSSLLLDIFSYILSTLIWMNIATSPERGLVVAFTVMIHEFGHAIAGLGYGYKIKSSRFYVLFAFVKFEKSDFDVNKEHDLIVTFAGPLANLAMVLAAFVYQIFFGRLPILEVAMSINFIFFIGNMLNFVILDGGKIRRILEQLYMETEPAFVMKIIEVLKSNRYISNSKYLNAEKLYETKGLFLHLFYGFQWLAFFIFIVHLYLTK